MIRSTCRLLSPLGLDNVTICNSSKDASLVTGGLFSVDRQQALFQNKSTQALLQFRELFLQDSTWAMAPHIVPRRLLTRR